jgi:hypothetical protein
VKRLPTIVTLTLLALGASSGVVSSPASAARFTSGTGKATLGAEANGSLTFTVGGGNFLSCGKFSLDETVTASEEVEEITASPTFNEAPVSSGCFLVGAEKQDITTWIDMNGCDFVFTASGTLHVSCISGHEIVVELFLAGKLRPCMTIPAQTPTSPTVSYENIKYKEKGAIELVFEVGGIEYTTDPLCGSGVFNNLGLTGRAKVFSKNSEGAPVNLVWDE